MYLSSCGPHLIIVWVCRDMITSLSALPDALLVHIAVKVLGPVDCIRLSSRVSKTLSAALVPALQAALARRLQWDASSTFGYKISDTGICATLVGVPGSSKLWAAGSLLPSGGIWTWEIHMNSQLPCAIGVCSADGKSAWGVLHVVLDETVSGRWTRDADCNATFHQYAKASVLQLRSRTVHVTVDLDKGLLSLETRHNKVVAHTLEIHQCRNGFVMNFPCGTRVRPWALIGGRRGDAVRFCSKFCHPTPSLPELQDRWTRPVFTD